MPAENLEIPAAVTLGNVKIIEGSVRSLDGSLMFRPKASQTQNTNVRLPKQMAMPSVTDVQFMLAETMKNKGRTVEMPYVVNGQNYLITARVDLMEETHEPIWVYYKGDGENAETVFQYATGDVNLIHNLVLQTSGADSNDLNANNYVSATTNEQAPKTTQTLTSIEVGVIKDKAKAILEGELANMQIPTLLQSINMSKMTGRLQIEFKTNMAAIFFAEGLPVHAVSPETKGDTAIIEIITWEDGQFHFIPNELTEERTVNRRLDALLMEGVAMLDQHKYLTERGCKLDSFIMKIHPQLTEDQFRQAVAKGAPLDLELQKRFYAAIDNRSTLLDILRRRPMNKVEWMPIMFNLLSCNLVNVVEAPPAGGKASLLQAVAIDRPAIQSVVRQLSRPETGIFNYPAFLYFLEQEYFKCAAMGVPLSLVLFEMKVKYGDLLEAMPTNSVKEAARKIEAIKRAFDVMGHFETFDFALFLPNTHSKSAKLFCQRINEVLNAEQLVPGPPSQVSLTFGIATAPEDTQDLGVLLSAAREARNRARESGLVVTLFSEVELK
jgi:GGDEF domain-containing protein